jgi:pimeloyl-ACP methyl ester carboxylesterase
MKRIVAMLVLLLIVAVTPAAADDDFFSYDLVFPEVELRPGVTADIDVLVLQNSDRRCRNGHKGHRSKSIIALHGLANTANTWKPLANELFSDNPIGKEVCSILAINLPGRGYSSLPEGEADLSFGELTLNDHTQAVIGTLERVRQAGFHPETIMAHSQGGLIVQMVQQALLTDGSSLRAEFGIKKVLLLASIAPAGVLWEYSASGEGAEAVSQFLCFPGLEGCDAELGLHVAIPDWAWPYLFFAYQDTESIAVTDNIPMADVVRKKGYNSPEPLFASLQLLGLSLPDLPPFVRPMVNPGIFHKTGTRLACVAMSQDSFQSEGEPEALYEHLTNDSSLKRFAVVASDDAVHSMYISNPQGLLEALVPSNISLP